MAVPSWFNSEVYFLNKAKDMGIDNLTLKAMFETAGYDVGNAQSMYNHFVSYGDAESVSPNQYFSNREYLYNKAVQFYSDAQGIDPSQVTVSEQMIESMYIAIKGAGMSPWDHYLAYGAEEGVNPSTGFDTDVYLAAKVVQMNRDAQDGKTDWTKADLMKVFSDLGMTPLGHYLEYGWKEDLNYTPTAVGSGNPGDTFLLTENRDTIYGTSADDQFHAQVAGDLNDGDYIDGAGGYDTLYATVNDAVTGPSPIQPMIVNVEKIVLQAQGNATVDAGRIMGKVNASNIFGSDQGLQYLANNDSRADLNVENVRSYTTDMTIGWYNADPGTDFGVFFDEQYLKPVDQASSGTMRVELMDIKSADDTNSANPLQTNPYNVLKFDFTPNSGAATRITLTLENYNDGTDGGTFTYQDLVDAINAAIKAAGYEGVITAELGGSFTASSASTTDPNEIWSGTGNLVLIKSEQGSFSNAGWSATGDIPGDSAYRTIIRPLESTSCPLITTTIDLDNVGHVQWTDRYEGCLPDEGVFGDSAGTLAVGAQDNNNAGIERFIVRVDQGSWLESLTSTNNVLRAVDVVKADINGDGKAGNKQYLANNENVGELFIGATQEAGAGNPALWTLKAGLLETDGLSDVKYFNAEGYEGHLNIGAQFTNDGYAKYLDDVDGINTVYTGYAPGGAFEYNLGINDDILNMKLHGGMAADNDFVMNINAGAGNDLVNIFFANQAAGVDVPMTHNQMLDSAALRNVTINAGEGNDTVWSWGRGAVTVNGGAGADAIYVGQLEDGSAIAGGGTEHNAVWAFNVDPNHKTVDLSATVGAQAHDNDFQALNAATTLTGSTATNAGHGVWLTVNFKGFTAEVQIEGYSVSATGTLADIRTLDINKAIIKAISEDPVLSKLLIAKDGAGYGLIVESMIDGAMVAGDLGVSFRAWNGVTGANSVSQALGDRDGDYASQLADYNGTAQAPFDPATAFTTTNAPATGDAFQIDLSAVAGALPPAGEFLRVTIDGVTYYAENVGGAMTLAQLLTAAATTGGTLLSDVWTVNAGTPAATTVTRVDVTDNVGAGFTVPAAFADANATATGDATGVVTPTGAVPGVNDAFTGDLTTVTVTPAGEWFGIEVEGVTYYAQQAAAGATQLTVAQLLAAARVDGNGALLSSVWDMTGPANATVFTRIATADNDTAGGWAPGAETGNNADLLGTTTGAGNPVTGTNTGTDSINRVDGGADDDVIVLNVGSYVDDDGHLINDTLVLSGAFGNDHVTGFDTGIDKVEFNVGAAGFITGGQGGTTAALTAVITTMEQAIANAAGLTAAASAVSAGYMLVAGTTNEYVFFTVNNDGTAGVLASEVTVLGTVTLTNDEAFNNGDMINIVPA